MTTHLLRRFFVAAAAVGCVACSNDDGPEPTVARYPLTIEVKENPLVNPETPANATRAAITTTESLTAFTLDYQYGSEPSHGSMTATKGNDSNWASSDTWPTKAAENDDAVSWYAYTAGTFVTGTEPYINFTVDENAAAQKDLLVAKTNSKYSDTGGNVTFTFDHACTALRFYVKKATNLANYTLTITKVRLCNVVSQGRYDYTSSAWTPGSSHSSYTLYDGTAKTLGTTDYEALDASDAPYLFLIPQVLTAWDATTGPPSDSPEGGEPSVYLQITCAITKGSSNIYSGTAYIPFGAILEKGYQHDVKINIGKNSLYSGANTKIIQ